MLWIGQFESVPDETALERVGESGHSLALESLVAIGIDRHQRSVQFIDHLLEIRIVGP